MNARLPRAAQSTSNRRATLLASASVLGIATVLSVSGCQWTSKIQTQKDYDPGDGVSVRVGDVQLRNLLVVSGKEGGPGTLAAWAGNESDQPVTVTFAVGEGGRAELRVPPMGAASLGENGKPASLKAVPAAPGMLTDVTVSTPNGGSVHAQVPVIYPHGDSVYATMAPSGAPSGSAAPSASAPASGAPSASAPASASASASAGH